MVNQDSFTPQEYAKMVGMFPDPPQNPLPTGGYMDEGFDWVVHQAEGEEGEQKFIILFTFTHESGKTSVDEYPVYASNEREAIRGEIRRWKEAGLNDDEFDVQIKPLEAKRGINVPLQKHKGGYENLHYNCPYCKEELTIMGDGWESIVAVCENGNKGCHGLKIPRQYLENYLLYDWHINEGKSAETFEARGNMNVPLQKRGDYHYNCPYCKERLTIMGDGRGSIVAICENENKRCHGLEIPRQYLENFEEWNWYHNERKSAETFGANAGQFPFTFKPIEYYLEKTDDSYVVRSHPSGKAIMELNDAYNDMAAESVVRRLNQITNNQTYRYLQQITNGQNPQIPQYSLRKAKTKTGNSVVMYDESPVAELSVHYNRFQGIFADSVIKDLNRDLENNINGLLQFVTNKVGSGYMKDIGMNRAETFGAEGSFYQLEVKYKMEDGWEWYGDYDNKQDAINAYHEIYLKYPEVQLLEVDSEGDDDEIYRQRNFDLDAETFGAEAQPVSDEGEFLVIRNDMGKTKGFIEMEEDLEDDSIEMEISDDEMKEIAEITLDAEIGYDGAKDYARAIDSKFEGANKEGFFPADEEDFKDMLIEEIEEHIDLEDWNQEYRSDFVKPSRDWFSLALGTAAVVIGGSLFLQNRGVFKADGNGTETAPSLVAHPSTGDLLPADYEEMVVESTGYAVPVIPVSLDPSFMGSRFHALPTDRVVESNEPGIGAHTDVAMTRDTNYREPEQTMVTEPPFAYKFNAENGCKCSLLDRIKSFFTGKSCCEVKEANSITGQTPYFGVGFEPKNPQTRVIKETRPISLDPSTAPYLPTNLSGYTGQSYTPPSVYSDMMQIGITGQTPSFVSSQSSIGENRAGSRPVATSDSLQSVHGNLSAGVNQSYTDGSKTMSLSQWSIEYDVSQISDSEAFAVSRSSGERTMIRRV